MYICKFVWQMYRGANNELSTETAGDSDTIALSGPFFPEQDAAGVGVSTWKQPLFLIGPKLVLVQHRRQWLGRPVFSNRGVVWHVGVLSATNFKINGNIWGKELAKTNVFNCDYSRSLMEDGSKSLFLFYFLISWTEESNFLFIAWTLQSTLKHLPNTGMLSFPYC